MAYVTDQVIVVEISIYAETNMYQSAKRFQYLSPPHRVTPTSALAIARRPQALRG
jgi:hypothetical protein